MDKEDKEDKEMTGNSEGASKFQTGDRVKRAGSEGPLGTVQNVRVETVRQSIKAEGEEPPGVTVTVLWDNGTSSAFVPGGLEKA